MFGGRRGIFNRGAARYSGCLGGGEKFLTGRRRGIPVFKRAARNSFRGRRALPGRALHPYPVSSLILATVDQSLSTLECLLLVAKRRALLRRALHLPFPAALVANVQSWLGSPKLGIFGTGFECFEVLVESSSRKSSPL